jgi:ribosomal protein L37AE/L43A
MAVLALAVVLGCGGSSGPGGGAGAGGKSAAEARADLIATAKQMEGGMWEAIEEYVKSIESGVWSWEQGDRNIAGGKYTAETKAAYKKWREAKIAEDKAKKK